MIDDASLGLFHTYICDFQNPLSFEPILALLLLYIDLYVVIFKHLFFGLAKYWGGGVPPPPLVLRPCNDTTNKM